MGSGPLPERWLSCPRKSKGLLGNKFLAFKTPLDGKFDDQIELSCRFSPSMLISSLKSHKLKLGLWIDLTKTSRFYNKSEVEDAGCAYVKIECHGHAGAPTPEQTSTFISICSRFVTYHPMDVIGVHCTHGFNRTGFMLVSYMVEILDWSVEVALMEFATIRPPGIYKEEYIKELYRRYDDEADAPPAPPLPSWCLDEASSSGSCTVEHVNNRVTKNGRMPSGKRQKRYKENPTFMEGVPGVQPITDRKIIDKVQMKAAQLCDTRSDFFPGSQPVSMSKDNINLLSMKPYRVSWKADGTRYMMLISNKDEIYFLDRDNSIFKVNRIQFFHRKIANQHLTNTLLDGEMVIDKFGNTSIPRYLIYDIVAFENNKIGAQHFYPTRLRTIEVDIIQPRITAMKDGRIIKEKEPFSIRAKSFYDISMSSYLLGEKFAKQLTHEPDGLIYQPSEECYTCGQSPEVLKWKPLTMNSVDFLLEVETETREGYANQFVGILYAGNKQKFGEIKVTKPVRALNGKIIECKYENNQWILMRERTDKSFPNSYDTAVSVLRSIKDPITKDNLLQFIEHHKWKDPMPPPSGPPPMKRSRQ